VGKEMRRRALTSLDLPDLKADELQRLEVVQAVVVLELRVVNQRSLHHIPPAYHQINTQSRPMASS
jgi:hypothetical protein